VRTQQQAHTIGRRSFLKGIALGAAGATAPLASLSAAEGTGSSRVVIAERAELADRHALDRAVVKKTVDALVSRLSGKSNVDEAWRTFVAPRETVALKFNGLFKNASTSPDVIWAVCRGLVDAGVAENKILLYDRDIKDFETAGIKPFEDLPKVQFLVGKSAYDDEVKVGFVKTRLTRILTRDADAIINLPCLKHHVIAGVTLTMKNHTGSIPNAGDLHSKIDLIAELNALPAICKKTRLSICDATLGVFDRGPQLQSKAFAWQPKALMAATDFVALDAVGADMLLKARKEKGVGATKPQPTHIAHAAEIGLGTADLSKIEVVKA
jgi:uncharacterized protein (DUF362 family)